MVSARSTFVRAWRQELRGDRSSSLTREALVTVQSGPVETRKPLRDLPLLPGHGLLAELPPRADLYEEMYADSGS